MATSTAEAPSQPLAEGSVGSSSLSGGDSTVFAAINDERDRQRSCIELIASENFVSPAVLEAQGSILTNKYAEGYPHRRYYGGCANVDVVEDLAIERLNQLFASTYANVQPHSGSQANQAVLLALLTPGDTILGLDLKAGGHLTHAVRRSSADHGAACLAASDGASRRCFRAGQNTSQGSCHG